MAYEKHRFSPSLTSKDTCGRCGHPKWAMDRHEFNNSELAERIENLQQFLRGQGHTP